MRYLLFSILLFFFGVFLTLSSELITSRSYAIYDPLSVPNNKFGIHIISDSIDEASPAAALVNSSGGQWGYVTITITSKDRDTNRWQKFFDELRRKKLIPLVRIATKPAGDVWERPYEGEETAWADFLDTLNWPTKNRYVIIYNEPNHAAEWGGAVDARGYARVLDKTITALKGKHPDFFVINAGFDASAPQRIPNYQDQISFMQQMDDEVPGIFDKLDGWSSHSYPNPNFVGSPDGVGRGTVRTWYWERQLLRSLGASKDLPIFITETGWKHQEGLNPNSSYPSEHQLTEYYTKAFQNAWNDERIVAVTPFLLNYQHPPFDHFSFKRLGESPDGTNEDARDYPFYNGVQVIPKTKGQPVQEKKAKLVKGEVYRNLVAGENYTIPLTFKNIGQSIWNDGDEVQLVFIKGGRELGIVNTKLTKKVEPQGEYTFRVDVRAPAGGTYFTSLNLFSDNKQFDNPPFEFTTEIKSPVIVKVKAALKWKDNFAGDYVLSVAGAVNDQLGIVRLSPSGDQVDKMEQHQLLPDYSFDFTLSKPFYKPKTITQTVRSGENILDFGELQPDFTSVLLKPKEFWGLLPFSN